MNLGKFTAIEERLVEEVGGQNQMTNSKYWSRLLWTERIFCIQKPRLTYRLAIKRHQVSGGDADEMADSYLAALLVLWRQPLTLLWTSRDLGASEVTSANRRQSALMQHTAKGPLSRYSQLCGQSLKLAHVLHCTANILALAFLVPFPQPPHLPLAVAPLLPPWFPIIVVASPHASSSAHYAPFI